MSAGAAPAKAREEAEKAAADKADALAEEALARRRGELAEIERRAQAAEEKAHRHHEAEQRLAAEIQQHHATLGHLSSAEHEAPELIEAAEKLMRALTDAMIMLHGCAHTPLPPAHLALLQEDAETALATAKTLKEWLEGATALRYADRAATLRREQGKDTGTVRFADGDVTVVADLPKKADRDQAQLATLIERIRAAGDDPADYVEITYRLPERKYAAWPARILRSVRTSAHGAYGQADFHSQPHGGSPLKTSGRGGA